jgi:hypothetical protein
MRADIHRLLVWMALFYMAMAYLESSVVVYLRALYYPEGFDFPLVPMDRSLVSTEVWRELATLFMLLAPAALVTRSALERFAWFCFGFGIWDIFYYVWLKVLLDWPSSWMSRDLLFLIPVPWVGPVWAPCLVSFGLITFAMLVLRGRSKYVGFRVDGWSWAMIICGGLLIILSFTLDPFLKSGQIDALMSIKTLGETGASALMDGRNYIPERFPWPWFLAGFGMAGAGLARMVRTNGAFRSPRSC